MVSDRTLDKPGYPRVAAPHGKLLIEAFLRQTGVGTHAQHVCPHACCSAVPATLTHIFVTCSVAAAKVAWVSATLGP